MTIPAVWYPLAKVRFQLRVEDFADDAPVPVPAVQPDSGSEAFGLAQEHVQVPGVFKSVGYDIVPFSVALERNSYRKADECRITIPLARMPFDCRVIRSATVQVFGGVVDPITWARAFDGDDAPGLMLPDATQAGDSNELFRGFVDDWEISIGTNDMLEVTARDLTSFFTDAELPQNALKDIPATTKLDDVIRLLVFGDGLPDAASRRKGLPGVKGLVIINETDGDLPRLSEIKPPNWFDSKKTTKKGRKRTTNDGQKMSYWDMITDLCVAAGFIVYVRPGARGGQTGPGVKALPSAAELVISDPRTYYAQSTTSGAEIVSESDVRQFRYGLNAANVKMRRKFEGVKTPTIEVRSWDEKAGEALTGRFPIKLKNNKPAPSGQGDREEVQVFILRDASGPGAQDMLNRAARSIYEQLSRGEFELQFTTKALAALPRNNNPTDNPPLGEIVPEVADADMFRLLAGDPILFDTDRANDEAGQVSSFTLINGLPQQAQVTAMTAAGIRPDLARQVAVANASQYVQREFRLQRLLMNWDKGNGWTFDVRAINFLDIRHAVDNGE